MKHKNAIPSGRSVARSLGHELPKVNPAPVIISTAAVAATILIACLASRWIFDFMVKPSNERSATSMYGEGLVLPPSPRLEGIEMVSGIGKDEQPAPTSQLQSYGWTDRDKRLIRVPIDRAMRLAIELNWLPSKSPKPTSDQSSPPRQSKSSEQKGAEQ
jgi:hypothetical protein